MNKETYEALKRIIKEFSKTINPDSLEDGYFREDIKQIEDWIDEVAKEYKGKNEQILTRESQI